MARTVNPKNGEFLATYQDASPNDVQRVVTDAHIGQMHWQWLGLKARSNLVSKVGRILIKEKQALARLITDEMGKPIAQSLKEVEKCALVCDYYSKKAAAFLKPLSAVGAKVVWEPLGCVLGIMPWNFPAWQIFRYAVPALIGGNVSITKPAPNTAGTAIRIAELFRSAGFPSGVFQVLVTEPENLIPLYQDPRIGGVTLTGSERAGRLVGGLAASGLKPTVLELGGNDPYLVLKDANVELAAKVCVESRLINAGQSCVAAKRLLVHSRVIEKFKKLVLKEVANYPMGDPREAATKIGPLAREDLRTALHSQVKKSVALGAKALIGCSVPEGRGFYYPVSVLDAVRPGMPAFDEELFGPVISLTSFGDDEEAVDLANRSRFGLGAAVFSRSRTRALAIASELKVGMVAINGMVASHPRLPFGGVKASGYGRELSDVGLRSFLNIKTVIN